MLDSGPWIPSACMVTGKYILAYIMKGESTKVTNITISNAYAYIQLVYEGISSVRMSAETGN